METGSKKYAIRNLKRLKDGTMGVQFLDAQTGQPVNDLSGYELYNDYGDSLPVNTNKAPTYVPPEKEEIPEYVMPTRKENFVGKSKKDAGTKATTDKSPVVEEEVKEAEGVAKPEAPSKIDEEKGTGRGERPDQAGDAAITDNTGSRFLSVFDVDTSDPKKSASQQVKEALDHVNAAVARSDEEQQEQTNRNIQQEWSNAQKDIFENVPHDLQTVQDQWDNASKAIREQGPRFEFTPEESQLMTDLEDRKWTDINLTEVEKANPNAGRNVTPTSNIDSMVARAVKENFGPEYGVRNLSGKESKQRMDSLGPVGSHKNHPPGWSGDYTVTKNGVDIDIAKPEYSKQTTGTLRDLSAQGQGIGFGVGYMDKDGTAMFHAGTPPNDPTIGWGRDKTRNSMDPQLYAELEEGRKAGLVGLSAKRQNTAYEKGRTPTPTSRETVMENVLGPKEVDPNFSDRGARLGMSKREYDQNHAVNTSVGSTMTPAESLFSGYSQFTKEEKDQISRAIAGEISAEVGNAFMAKDPDAIAEVSNMIGTIENTRNKDGTINVSGARINSMMGSKSKVTDENETKYGTAIKEHLEAIASGSVSHTLTAPTSTNWANPGAIKGPPPGWMSKVETNVKQKNDQWHNFYTDPGYRTKSVNRSRIDQNEHLTPDEQRASFDYGRDLAGRAMRDQKERESLITRDDSTLGAYDSMGLASGWGGLNVGNSNAPNAGGGRVGTSGGSSGGGSYGYGQAQGMDDSVNSSLGGDRGYTQAQGMDDSVNDSLGSGGGGGGYGYGGGGSTSSSDTSEYGGGGGYGGSSNDGGSRPDQGGENSASSSSNSSRSSPNDGGSRPDQGGENRSSGSNSPTSGSSTSNSTGGYSDGGGPGGRDTDRGDGQGGLGGWGGWI